MGCATAPGTAGGLGVLVALLGLVAHGIALRAALPRRLRQRVVAALLALGISGSAAAGTPPPTEAPPPPKAEIHLLARGMIERWNDPSIATAYKAGTWLAGAGLVFDLLGPLGVDVEAGYSRLQGQGDAQLEVAPLSMLVELTAPLGRADAFLGAGPAWTVFTETGGPKAIDGARLSAEIRGGVRIDTGLIQPAAPPAPAPVRRMEVELAFARRAELPGGPPKGLHLGAWRATVGLGVVF
ncbi:MAG: hypothetical protein R3F59_25165 [Myxococcota bacterium]